MNDLMDIFFNLYVSIDMADKDETKKDKIHLNSLYSTLICNRDKNLPMGVKSKEVEGRVLDEIQKLREKYNVLDICICNCSI